MANSQVAVYLASTVRLFTEFGQPKPGMMIVPRCLVEEEIEFLDMLHDHLANQELLPQSDLEQLEKQKLYYQTLLG